MIGYGVNTSQSNPPPGYQSDTVLSSQEKSNQPKIELTLVQKQEMATKLERETQNGHSMSLNNLKAITNSNSSKVNDLMDKNFNDLNLMSDSNNPTTKSNSSSGSSNFDLLAQQMSTSSTSSVASNSFQNSFQQNRPFSNSNNNSNFSPFDNLNPLNKSQNTQYKPLQQQAQNNKNMFNNQQQVGFFGNLALPAPNNLAQSTIMNQSPSLNAMRPTASTPAMYKPNNFQISNSTQQAPLIPGPPKSNPTNANLMSNNSQSNNKTALDDLADIFG